MITVARLHRRCIASPSIWQGITLEGKLFYAYFHQGVLEAGIALSDSTPHHIKCKQPIYQKKISSKRDGWLSDEDLGAHLKHIVQLPQAPIGLIT